MEDTHLTARESELVKDAWDIGVMPRYEQHAMEFFLAIFAKDPEVMDRFPFLKTEEHVENNSRLQKHANIALLMAGDAMASLGEADTAIQVRRRLRLLGRLHVKFGMQAHYFPIVRSCFLEMLVKSFRSMWSDELEAAWTKALTIVIGEMEAGLKEGLDAHKS